MLVILFGNTLKRPSKNIDPPKHFLIMRRSRAFGSKRMWRKCQLLLLRNMDQASQLLEFLGSLTRFPVFHKKHNQRKTHGRQICRDMAAATTCLVPGASELHLR